MQHRGGEIDLIRMMMPACGWRQKAAFLSMENFTDEWEEEALGGQLTVVQNNMLNQRQDFLGSKSVSRKFCIIEEWLYSPVMLLLT